MVQQTIQTSKISYFVVCVTHWFNLHSLSPQRFASIFFEHWDNFGVNTHTVWCHTGDFKEPIKTFILFEWMNEWMSVQLICYWLSCEVRQLMFIVANRSKFRYQYCKLVLSILIPNRSNLFTNNLTPHRIQHIII